MSILVLAEHDHASLQSPTLHAVAAALLERETLTSEDIAILVRGEKLPPRKITPPTAPATNKPALAPQPRPAKPPLLGGPEPSPA